jgi:pyrroloquinoline-quinone synthase
VSAAAREEAQAAPSFLARLEALAERHYQHRHPFNALMHTGRLDKGDLRLWVANRYYYQTRVPIKDALIVAKAEDPAFRRVWIQRVLEHDGQGEARQPGSAQAAPGGLEPLRRLGAALGLAEAELASGAYLLPEVRVACDEYVEGVRDADLITAVAFSLTEYFASRLMPVRSESWLRHYRFVDDRAIEYFERRVTRTRADAEFALAFVQRHATTPELEQRCLDAFVSKCSILWRLLDAVYVARRRGRFPGIESPVWLMRMSALGVEDARGQSAAPGVLMMPERALQLNRTAYDLLERCDGKHTLERIMQELAERHVAPPGLVERDVATFVAELERRSVVSFQRSPRRSDQRRERRES